MSLPPRILVVEDEAVVAIDIQVQLQRLGYRVAGTASSAREAVDKATALEPDLVLMDVRLEGGSDGIEAAERIRRGLGTPVVFLTAFADEETLRRAKAASPHGYILKPFDEQDLSATIEIALSRVRMEQALERSYANLLAVLNAQRQGAVAIAADGRVSFLSRPATRMLGRSGSDLAGKPWTEALGLPPEATERIREMAERPAGRREKVPASLGGPDGRRYRLEIEIVEDPRAEGRFILFLYDVSELYSLRRLLDSEASFENIVGTSKGMQAVFQLIRDLAQVDSSVVIEGETGTGKELVAQAIHNTSHRAQGPFIAVNCGGLSPELASSQLFGHRRGAFTGAVADRAGFFEAANGGTLFLDEIGDLPAAVQPSLLRALEERKVARVGEVRLRGVDVRLLAATSRNLDEEIERGNFRPDLFYRLSVARIHLPPLRERPEDLPLLIRSFLSEARARTGKEVERVGDEAMRLLLGYHWPGNVRQLKNAVEFAVIRAKGSEIVAGDLTPELLRSVVSRPDPAREPERIRAALEASGGNRKKAAELLGMSRSTFYRRLEQLGLKD